ncbi:DNAJ heat shock N-terminal domain-containing protein [Heterostelium album PN500]|uniref:DNAJ heat shock N-terminal domain-containing protein n=1 Tax=Heterostelium pallidum (strain ATCC 26659 / Pp 5 / PN500) TaxID=670386 RepID=D3BRL5_HETP5|nr:DNAJ heat shock N-terminal domain-containing protein [Heterostelium album PN500]EFA76047.1 DNAJ heat shock N-terminal domain-containing protein [Heterostelium album PN500]|eukprot:XP_020428181.1 DNAJ heat shock N-terminal domain-containing protein [Heterostelium album PN500]
MNQSSILLFILFTFTCIIAGVNSISKDIENLIKEGDDLFKQSRFDSSIDRYSSAIDKIGDAAEADVPTLINVLFKRAGIYQTRSKNTLALSDVNRALQYNPDNIHAKIKRAKILTSMGRFEQAREDYNAVLKAKPTNSEAKKQLELIDRVNKQLVEARALMESKRYQDALPILNSILSTTSEIKEIKLLRAEASYHTGDFKRTIEDTTSVLKSEGSNVNAFYWRGKAFFAIGEKDAAIKYLNDALKFDADNQMVKQQLKDYTNFDKASNNAKEYFGQNRFDETLKEIEAALKIESSSPIYSAPLYLLKCKALLKTRKGQDAVNTCTKLISIEESADAFYNRGEAYMYLDDYDKALSDFQKASQLRPNDGAIHDGIRRAQMKQKQASRKDYYKILGVDKAATEREIKKQFKRLSVLHHPDKVDQNDEDAKKKYIDITEAYEVLSDPEKRERYDRGDDLQGGGQPGFHQQQQGFPFGFGFQGHQGGHHGHHQQQQGGYTFSFNFGQ